MFDQLQNYKGNAIVVELMNGRRIAGTVAAVNQQELRLDTDEGVCIILISTIQILWENLNSTLTERIPKYTTQQLRTAAGEDIPEGQPLCFQQFFHPCSSPFQPCRGQFAAPCLEMFQHPCYERFAAPCFEMFHHPCRGQFAAPCLEMFQHPCYERFENPCCDPCYYRFNDPCYAPFYDKPIYPCYERFQRPCFYPFGFGPQYPGQ